MSTTNSPAQESAGTTLESIADYDYEMTAHGTHRWTHVETGLTVEMRRRAGRTDGYGREEHGYTALVRAADGQVVADIIEADTGYLPSKREAWDRVREWLQNRPEGER